MSSTYKVTLSDELLHFPKITSKHIVYLILKNLRKPRNWTRAWALYYYFFTPNLKKALEWYNRKDFRSYHSLNKLLQSRKYWHEICVKEQLLESLVKRILKQQVISIYTDGGFRDSGFIGVWGFLVQNTNTIQCGLDSCIRSSHQAEFFALRQAVNWIKTQPRHYYFLFSDSSSLVDAINSARDFYSQLGREGFDKLYSEQHELRELVRATMTIDLELNWVSNTHELLHVIDTQCDLMIQGKKKRRKNKRNQKKALERRKR